MSLISLLLGGGVGLVSSLLGLGGGILLVPLLPLVTDLSRKESVVVSLATILVIVSSNTYFFAKDKKVNWRAVFSYGPSTALGAFGAAFFLSEKVSGEGLKWLLTATLLIWAVFNTYKVFIKSANENTVPSDSTWSVAKNFATALFAGALSGLLGIGSGLIISIVFVGIVWIKNEEISPTSNGVMIFTTSTGLLGYFLAWPYKEVIYLIVENSSIIVLGALIASYIGRPYQSKIPRKVRAGILIFILLSLAFKTLVS